MITRLWCGRATAANAPHYQHHATRRVFPSLASIPGHRGAYLLVRKAKDEVEFLAVTLWDGIDAVKSFTGENPEVAVVEPQARAILAAFDRFVSHYEVVSSPPGNVSAA